MTEYKLIKLKPQRVRGNVNAWVWARDRGYICSWKEAIDYSFRKGLQVRKDDFIEGKGAIGS